MRPVARDVKQLKDALLLAIRHQRKLVGLKRPWEVGEPHVQTEFLDTIVSTGCRINDYGIEKLNICAILHSIGLICFH